MTTTLRRAEKDFTARYPDYRGTASLDRLRRTEYRRLDRLGHTYLDYTGGSLYATSQIERHRALLRGSVLGNPHSQNPTSLWASELAEKTRADVLRFFNAPAEEYDVVFTSNASGAIKLVAESYPFDERSCYLMTYDNHNSVNGVREFAARAGARIEYLPVRPDDLRMDGDRVLTALNEPRDCSRRLFAYPAQSNFSGVQHPLEWVDAAHEAGWDVLLDCAAFAPTNRLDLSAVRPDFVPISFYKLFGYPTGVGALIVRHTALASLRRPWFSGGSILMVSVHNNWATLAPGHAGFEDGTIDYANLPAVSIGLEHLERVGVETIHTRVGCLTAELLDRLGGLRHATGSPLVRIHGPRDGRARGATIAFALHDPAGRAYDVDRVEQLAGERLISLRSGCFCNPGDREVAHGIDAGDLEPCFAGPAGGLEPDSCNHRIFAEKGTMPSSLRASLGIASDYADCHRFLAFLAGFIDVRAEDVGGALYD